MHRLPPRELLTAVHVLVVLAVVEASIRWIPLPRLGRLFGVRVDLGPPARDVEQFQASALSAQECRQLRWTGRIADVWPLSKGPCLRRSLVAGHLLRDRAPAVRLGFRGSDAASAHAWLEIDGRPLEDVHDFHVFHQVAEPAS